MSRTLPQIIFLCLFLSSCTSFSPSSQFHIDELPPGVGQNNPLYNVVSLNASHWSLVEIQSMDDSLYTPAVSSEYLISFSPQGNFTARLDCNQIRWDWTHTGRSQLQINPLISTRALCAPDSLYDRILSDLGYTRSFVLENNHLFLATLADGAILEFAPYNPVDFEISPSFACDQAQGTVESMVCEDEELMKLDLYLDELFRAALKNFPEEELASLRAIQRGWISGRNDCWKDADIRPCVVDQYLTRLSELEVKSG